MGLKQINYETICCCQPDFKISELGQVKNVPNNQNSDQLYFSSQFFLFKSIWFLIFEISLLRFLFVYVLNWMYLTFFSIIFCTVIQNYLKKIKAKKNLEKKKKKKKKKK